MFNFDGSQVNFGIAFLAGVSTFFASCLLPLVPTYLAYLSGTSLTQDSQDQSSAITKKWQVFQTALLFVTGFVIAFTLLGLTINQLSIVIRPYKLVIEKLGGLLFITMGLLMLGVLQNQTLQQEARFDVHHLFTKHRHLHAVLVGLAFGVGWTPCIGPVLAVILYWAGQTDSAIYGSLLLTTYGIGLGTPFLIIALGFEKLIPLLKKYRRISQYITYFAGSIIVATGVLLLLGQFKTVSVLTLKWLHLSPLAK